MANWKTLGFVPDSDDEEDNLALPIQNSRDKAGEIDDRPLKAVPTTIDHINHATPSLEMTDQSTVNQLEKALSHGLQTVRDVLDTASVQVAPDTNENDSPLSSPPSSLASSPPRFGTPEGNALQTQQATSSPRLDIDSIDAAGVPRRNLRVRAPIQQHPYMLEGAQYRQMMKTVGLKPVNLPTVSTVEERQNKDQDTQDTDDYEISQLENFSNLNFPSSAATTQSIHNGISIQGRADPGNELKHDDAEDELPDLSQILHKRDRPSKRMHKARDRSTPLALNSASTDIFDLPDDENHGRESSLLNQIFRVPPSPPHSENPLASDNDENEDVTTNHRQSKGSSTPHALLTPLVSSDNGLRKRPVTVISSSESSQSDGDDHATMPPSPAAEDDDSQGMKRIRRQLRGVLPKSFLSLNQSTQACSRAQKYVFNSSAGPTKERGVARMVGAGVARPMGQTNSNALQLSESDSSETEEVVILNSRQQRRAPFSTSSTTINDDSVITGDAAEEDEIDPMLPWTGTRRRTTNHGIRRQRRINDGWAVSYHRTGTDAASAGLIGTNYKSLRTRKKHATTQKRKKTRHRPQSPKLAILDAPGLREKDKRMQPQFLKIATRRARTSAHQLYSDPSKKFFSLATEDDTREVTDQLELWRRHRSSVESSAADARLNVSAKQTIRAASSTGLSTSKDPAYNPRIENVSAVVSAVDITSLKQTTNAILSRVSSSRRLHPGQTSASENIQPADLTPEEQPPGHAAFYLSSLFAHRNRSGQGQLLSRRPGSRAAQVESECVPQRALPALPVRTITKSTKQPRAIPAAINQRSNSTLQDSSLAPKVIRRISRKQVPKRSIVPTANMNSANLDATLRGVNNRIAESPAALQTKDKASAHDEAESYLNRFCDFVQCLDSLSEHEEFRSGTVIGDSLLHNTERKLSDTSYDPTQPTSDPSLVLAPFSGSVACGVCDEEVEMLFSKALTEIETAIFEGEGPPARYNECWLSLNSMVTYLLTAIYFKDGPKATAMECLKNFIHKVSGKIQDFVARSATEQNQASASRRKLIVQTLNWYTILALNLHVLARKADISTQNQTKGLCKGTLGRACEIVFEPQFLTQSLSHLQTLYESSSDESGLIDSFPEAATVPIAWHVCRMLSTDQSSKQFYEQLKCTLLLKGGLSWSSQFGLSVLALCFILPLTQYDSAGRRVNDCHKLKGRDGSCFALLVSHLQNLVAHTPSGRAPDSIGPMLEAMEDLCLKMVKIWCCKPPPELATALLKAYAWNAMLPFHTVPSQRDIFEDVEFLINNRSLRTGNDFYKFLELVELCLNALCHLDADTINGQYAPVPSRVKGLVYSLIPNNAGLFDAREDILAAQFLGLKNHFALYLTIFTCVPEGFQPRIEQLEQQVDFSTSHSSVCKLAVATWKALTLSYVQRADPGYSSLESVSGWMNTMLRQSMIYFESHHQFDALTRIEELLSTFATVLTDCDSEPKARILFRNETLETIVRILTESEPYRTYEPIVTAGSKLMHAYVNTTTTLNSLKDTMTSEVHLVLRQMIQQTLSNQTVNNPELLRHLMAAWFVTAHHMVRAYHKEWTHFMEPHSNLSIDFLSGLRNSCAAFEAKQRFYSDLIKTDPSFVFLECRPIVFTTWVAALLFPVQSMRAEHILTNSILKHESDSLTIKDLAAILYKHDNDKVLSLQEVANSRIIILRHIIQNVYGQQDCPEEVWLGGGLSSASLVDLLRTMTKTMKDVWTSLKDSPVEQSDYTALVHAILNEMEMYPIADFKIDPWFTGASEFPRPRQMLDNIFKCRFGEVQRDIQKVDILNFHRQYTHELQTDSDQPLINELLRVFHCTDPLRSRRADDGTIQYSIDIPKQAKFMQIVFPAYIACGSKQMQSLIMNPILELLIELTKCLQFRVDNLDPEHMNLHAITTAAILYAVRNAMEATHLRHQSTIAMLRYTRVAASSIFSLVEYGVEIDEPIFEMCIANVLGVYEVVRHHLPAVLNANHVPAPASVSGSNEDEHNDDIVNREDVVCSAWTDVPVENFNLVPEKMDWVLHFDAQEPKLDGEELELREYARAELKGWEGYLGEKEWMGPGLMEEMVGLVRDLKGRELVEVEEEEEEEEDHDQDDE